MSSELDDNRSLWEEPVDRRTGAGRGGRRRGRARARRPRRGEPRNGRSCPERGQGHGLLRPVHADRRAGGRSARSSSKASTGTSRPSSPRPAPMSSSTASGRRRKAGKGNIDLLIGLHGEFVTFQDEGLLRPVDAVTKQIKTLQAPLVKTGKLGTSSQWYVPHGQATYVMVAQQGRAQVHAQGREHRRASPTGRCSPGRRPSGKARDRAGSGCPRATPASSIASSRVS